MQALKMLHDADPRKLLLDTVGSVEQVALAPAQVLVAVYKRPEKTAGGLYLPDQTRKEDDYQGKVGLVLKTGPLAFVNDGRNDFGGFSVDVGDWVVFRPSDGWQLLVGKQLCRMLQDVDIKASIAEPDFVF